MGKIHVLDEHLTNMIAAGEVVERPANIVKECVENALDAHATNIDIEVTEGGIERIRIEDDGTGMDREDANKAFLRHATSKLIQEEDLFAIKTMGFRGEALASIASVADAVIETSDGKTGTRIHCEYGDLKAAEDMDRPQGTVVDVAGLFARTPARFKYLRKPAYEFSVIADIVNKMALTHPEVRFTLSHNGRRVFVTTGSGKKEEILYQMYGREVSQAAVPFQSENEDFKLTGLAVQPKITRASKYFIYLSVNGRLVRSKALQDAVIDAYGNYMPPNRYPICILNVETDPQMVDVNVHPNKWEVRLSKQPDLLELVRKTIADTFERELRTVQVKPEHLEPKINEFQRQAQTVEPYVPREYKEERNTTEWKPVPEPQKNLFDFDLEARDQKIQEAPIAYPIPTAPKSEETVHQVPAGNDFLHDLRIIGQLKDSYILCECAEGLAIIDQHAAQERLHYEELQEKLLKPETQVQPLMVPVLVQLKPALMANLDHLNSQVAAFGLHFEEFGKDKAVIRQLPLWMGETEPQPFLQDLLDQYEQKEMVDMAALRKHVIATMACHSSIRFNRPLTLAEMEEVINGLKRCRQPWHCPHGRPTVITLSDKDLRKEFERG